MALWLPLEAGGVSVGVVAMDLEVSYEFMVGAG